MPTEFHLAIFSEGNECTDCNNYKNKTTVNKRYGKPLKTYEVEGVEAWIYYDPRMVYFFDEKGEVITWLPYK